MTIHTVDQRSDEWRRLRLGKLTGSRAKAMLATIKTGESADRRDLRVKLVLERIVGTPQDSDFVNADMIWGTEHEDEARAAYEAATGRIVQAIGFCEHDDLMAGTSPDGFIDDDGILSIKCPRSANHIRILRDNIEPPEHAAQNLHELWLTGRAWVDFVSYDPRMPEHLQLAIIRVTRSEPQLSDYDTKVRAFLAEVDREEEAIRTFENPTQLRRTA